MVSCQPSLPVLVGSGERIHKAEQLMPQFSFTENLYAMPLTHPRRYPCPPGRRRWGIENATAAELGHTVLGRGARERRRTLRGRVSPAARLASGHLAHYR